MSSISIKTSKVINSSGSIPTSLQHLFKDEDKNGIPDFADDLVKSADSSSSTQININGRQYTSWDQVPQEVKQEFKDFAPSSADSQPRIVPGISSSVGQGQPLINFGFREVFLIVIGFILASAIFSFSR